MLALAGLITPSGRYIGSSMLYSIDAIATWLRSTESFARSKSIYTMIG
jgi:hypothetical protein